VGSSPYIKGITVNLGETRSWGLQGKKTQKSLGWLFPRGVSQLVIRKALKRGGGGDNIFDETNDLLRGRKKFQKDTTLEKKGEYGPKGGDTKNTTPSTN